MPLSGTETQGPLRFLGAAVLIAKYWFNTILGDQIS